MIEVSILCDECGRVAATVSGPKRELARDLRRKLHRNKGWTYKASGGKDFCPECSEKRKGAEDLERLRTMLKQSVDRLVDQMALGC